MIPKSQQSGFTLVEVATVMFIVSLLMTFAVPSFYSLLQNNQVTVATNSLVSDLNVARSEAIKLGQRVVLCRSNNVSSSSPSCSGTSAIWTTGRMVFVDIDNDQQFTAASDRLIRVTNANSNGINILADVQGQDEIIYNGDGTTSPATNLATTSIALCDERGITSGNIIRVGPTGRPRLVSPATTCTP